jgi:hypothetical protein
MFLYEGDLITCFVKQEDDPLWAVFLKEIMLMAMQFSFGVFGVGGRLDRYRFPGL